MSKAEVNKAKMKKRNVMRKALHTMALYIQPTAYVTERLLLVCSSTLFQSCKVLFVAPK